MAIEGAAENTPAGGNCREAELHLKSECNGYSQERQHRIDLQQSGLLLAAEPRDWNGAGTVDQFAEKLRLTAHALWCVTRKELCARFYEINPQTLFQLANSYKWIAGRARPRSRSVFNDWARLLDVGRSGQFLADCLLDEFRQLLAARYDLAAGQSPDALASVAAFSLGDLLQGRYAVYSPAWSRAARGSIIRGSLEIAAGTGGASPEATFPPGAGPSLPDENRE